MCCGVNACLFNYLCLPFYKFEGYRKMGDILRKPITAALWLILLALVGAQQNGTRPRGKSGYEYVNPLIGTTDGGQY